jgi:hypothetical protein
LAGFSVRLTLIEPSQTDHARFMRGFARGANLVSPYSHPGDVNSEVAVLPITTAVIGFLLGLGGLQELFVRGIWNGELPSLLVGAAGAVVSSLLIVAALAIWRRWSQWPRIAMVAGSLSIAFHLYGALPLPERYVGLLAMMLGVGIGIALLAYTIRRRESSPRLVRH